MLNVYRIANHCKIYGKGDRTAIWFQGCSIHCKGCINPHLWSFKKANLMEVDELVDAIKDEEVTLLGGDPLDQPDILLFIQALKKKNIGIILFTGYSLTKLSGNQLLATQLSDAVISEPFILSLLDPNLYLMGSSNQILTLNTNRYTLDDFEKKESVEVIIGDQVEIHGRQTDKFLWNLLGEKPKI